jgi:hypothetical protein
MLSRSLFDRERQDQTECWTYRFLSQHCRSCTDSIEFPNKEFYREEMIEDASTLQENSLFRTLRRFFSSLRPAWSDKWRMEIDFNCEGAISKRYGNTHYLYSDAELSIRSTTTKTPKSYRGMLAFSRFTRVKSVRSLRNCTKPVPNPQGESTAPWTHSVNVHANTYGMPN